jgi:hypothetical protein
MAVGQGNPAGFKQSHTFDQEERVQIPNVGAPNYPDDFGELPEQDGPDVQFEEEASLWDEERADRAVAQIAIPDTGPDPREAEDRQLALRRRVPDRAAGMVLLRNIHRTAVHTGSAKIKPGEAANVEQAIADLLIFKGLCEEL